jgi:hypothetical protein
MLLALQERLRGLELQRVQQREQRLRQQQVQQRLELQREQRLLLFYRKQPGQQQR